MEIVRCSQIRDNAENRQAIARAVTPWLTDPFASTALISHPLQEGTLRIVSARFGHVGDAGIMVAGSLGSHFPSAQERLLISVGANQAAMAIQREHLARLTAEIHDSLAQSFTGITMQLQIAQEVLSSTGVDSLGNIHRAIELANIGLAEARRCAHNFHSSVVDEPGLTVSLQRLVERWTVAGRLRCDFRSNVVPDDRICAKAKNQLLRIAQEAIHNAVRHASPTLILVTLKWSAPNLVLQVSDNGLGMAAARLKKCEGFGLKNMRKRASEIGATFEIQSAAGRGTNVIVTLPSH
jgi:signal transduction histidine kinase